jgi:hypothetical protein
MSRRRSDLTGRWLAVTVLMATAVCVRAADAPRLTPANPDLMKLRVNDHCRIWVVEILPNQKKSFQQYTGDVGAMTKHTILMTKVTVRTWSESTKTILDKTQISRLFPNIGSSSQTKDTVQVFRAKITKVEILKAK